MKLHYIAFLLVVAGGLNWLLIGLVGWNAVSELLGPSIADWVYLLVGLATVYEVVMHKKQCKVCGGASGGQM